MHCGSSRCTLQRGLRDTVARPIGQESRCARVPAGAGFLAEEGMVAPLEKRNWHFKALRDTAILFIGMSQVLSWTGTQSPTQHVTTQLSVRTHSIGQDLEQREEERGEDRLREKTDRPITKSGTMGQMRKIKKKRQRQTERRREKQTHEVKT